jgi:hypothetical protein
MKIEKESIAQAIDPNTKQVLYQSSNKSEQELLDWFQKKVTQGKFAGLECKISSRYLVNGRPFYVEQKHILWLLIGAQFLFIVWSLSQ